MRDAIDRAERGIVDADLGGGLIKQRVARSGQGRSGGLSYAARLSGGGSGRISLWLRQKRTENVDSDQLFELRKIAIGWLEETVERIERALEEDRLEEIYVEDEGDS